MELPIVCAQSRFHLRLCCFTFPQLPCPNRDLDISTEHRNTSCSLGFSFSHSPRGGGKQGGGAGLLITREWNYTPLTILDTSASTFEFLAVSISHPVNLTIVVIYRPPHQLGNFLEEIEALLSNLPDNGFPLIVLGDFNLPTAKERDPFVALLADFHLDLTPGQATHKKGNELDLVFTRNAKIPNMVATPLHVSDHYFLSFTAFFLSHLPLADLPEPEMVTTDLISAHSPRRTFPQWSCRHYQILKHFHSYPQRKQRIPYSLPSRPH